MKKIEGRAKAMLVTSSRLHAKRYFEAFKQYIKDKGYEKFYAYARLLLTKLPKRNLSERMKFVDEAAIEYYRLQKIREGSIDLITGEQGELDGLSEAGIKRAKDEMIPLSEMIDTLHERFGTEFEEADRLFFEQILEDQAFGGLVKELMMRKVYTRLNEDAEKNS